MRLSIITISLLLGLSTLVSGEISIDAQIQRIQNASPSERYKLVNQLKEQIARMNAQQQARSISKYQEMSLKTEQNANIANQIAIQEMVRQTQTQDTIVPPVTELPASKLAPSSVPQTSTPTPEPVVPTSTPQSEPTIQPKPTYEAPTPSYTRPEPEYVEPVVQPKPTYVEPSYEAPTPSYTEPEQTYEAPANSSPQQSYEAPVSQPEPSSVEPSYSQPSSSPAPSSAPSVSVPSKRGGF